MSCRSCPLFDGFNDCERGSSCRKWHIYQPLRGTLTQKSPNLSPLAKGDRYEQYRQYYSAEHQGRVYHTAGYRNEELRRIFYAERFLKGEPHNGVWWYPTPETADNALRRVISEVHNHAMTSPASWNDDSKIQGTTHATTKKPSPDRAADSGSHSESGRPISKRPSPRDVDVSKSSASSDTASDPKPTSDVASEGDPKRVDLSPFAAAIVSAMSDTTVPTRHRL